MEVGHVLREQVTHNRVLGRTVEHSSYGQAEPIPEVTAEIEVPRHNP